LRRLLLRPQLITWFPFSASASANASPIPLPPPAIRTVFPEIFMISYFHSALVSAAALGSARTSRTASMTTKPHLPLLGKIAGTHDLRVYNHPHRDKIHALAPSKFLDKAHAAHDRSNRGHKLAGEMKRNTVGLCCQLRDIPRGKKRAPPPRHEYADSDTVPCRRLHSSPSGARCLEPGIMSRYPSPPESSQPCLKRHGCLRVTPPSALCPQEPLCFDRSLFQRPA
jgi:hypothetical protein